MVIIKKLFTYLLTYLPAIDRPGCIKIRQLFLYCTVCPYHYCIVNIVFGFRVGLQACVFIVNCVCLVHYSRNGTVAVDHGSLSKKSH